MNTNVTSRSNAKGAKDAKVEPISYGESRLCRARCGKAPPFRKIESLNGEAAPRAALMRQSLKTEIEGVPERRSLSAQQAAEPRWPNRRYQRSGFFL